MSFRKETTTIPEVKINDEQAKEFERQLMGRTFKQYCFDEGFYIQNDSYTQIAIAYSKVMEYNHARKLNNALEDLKLRRSYAKKQEHLSIIQSLLP